MRRLEIINGIGGRRRWSAEDKGRILEETLTPGAVVSEVARRHGLTPQQLFGWRREARRTQEVSEVAPAMFVPAVVEAPTPTMPESPARSRQGGGAGLIEVEIDGVTVRVGRGAEAKTVAAVIRALKAAR